MNSYDRIYDLLLEYRKKPDKPSENKPAWKMYPGQKKDIDKGTCPWCKNPVGEFKDTKSEKEYGISGLCQNCQDDFFKGKK